MKKDKNCFIRIVKNKQNEICVDKTGKQEGRGAYICNIECLEKAKKARRLDKVFKMKINDDVYENLNVLINGGESIG